MSLIVPRGSVINSPDMKFFYRDKMNELLVIQLAGGHSNITGLVHIKC